MLTPTLALAISVLSQSPDPVVMDGTKQLFLDDYLIASSENVVRRLHPLAKSAHNPILRGDRPWENKVAILYGSVRPSGVLAQ